jgi:5-methylcytosine-specific restriction endonuclease McrA
MLTRPRYRIQGCEEHYCNRQCAGKARTRRFAQANHPNWRGGGAFYRGPNWHTQAAKARKRDDYKCQRCGISQKKLGRKLDVHHITPFRTFGYIKDENDNYKKANQLSNLITLCSECHKSVEHGRTSVQLRLMS